MVINNCIQAEKKKETKFEISKLDDIYNYSDQIIKATERLLKGEKAKLVEKQSWEKATKELQLKTSATRQVRPRLLGVVFGVHLK